MSVCKDWASHLNYLVQGVVYIWSQIMCGIAIASYGCGLRHVRCRSFCKHWFATIWRGRASFKTSPSPHTLSRSTTWNWFLIYRRENVIKFICCCQIFNCGCVRMQHVSQVGWWLWNCGYAFSLFCDGWLEAEMYKNKDEWLFLIWSRCNKRQQGRQASSKTRQPSINIRQASVDEKRRFLRT